MSGALQAVFQNQRSFITVPGAPTIGTATATGLTTATVSYTAPANNGGSTITLYTATSSPGGITGTLAQAGSGTISISGLTTGTAYTFTVTATNSVGTSAASAASNSVTPNYVGFLSAITASSSSIQYTFGLRNDSSGVNYLTEYNASGGSIGLMKVSTTGALTYQRKNYGTNEGGYGAFYIDSSNNYYFTGVSGSTFKTLKYDSSDANQWIRSFSETSGSVVNTYSTVTTDSSGNVYVACDTYTNIGCCSVSNFIGVRKLDSSGAVVSGNVAIDIKATGLAISTMGIFIDSSNNIFCLFKGRGSGNEAMSVMKLDSSFAISAQGNFYVSGGVQPYGANFDVANTVGYMCGRNNQAVILKFNSSCVRSWSYELTTMRIMFSCAVDSSGNIYGAGYELTTNAMLIVKINSSGVLQWARRLSNNNATFGFNNASSINISGSRFTVTTINNLFSPAKLLVFSAPTDGTGTGSFSNSGYTWTYASYSETLTSLAMSTGVGMTLATRTTTNATVAAPTLTTTTSTASATQF